MTVDAEPNKVDAAKAIETFRSAAKLNREDPYRNGCLLRLPAYGQAVMTGDLHGHQKNLEKLQKYAMLDRMHARHVVLHEMIHTILHAPEDVDDSHELFLRAARYKCEHPEQVHFLQSNHELAQLTGYLIAKNGRIVVQEFNHAVESAYGETDAPAVLEAMKEFIASFPAAIRTENRVWLSHSLPDVHNMNEFEPDVFRQVLTREELATNRTVFQLVWGRRHTKKQIEGLADRLDVDTFIIGHQPQETGFAVLFERMIILASDHNHGTFLPFDLSKRRSAAELISGIRKFVAVA